MEPTATLDFPKTGNPTIDTVGLVIAWAWAVFSMLATLPLGKVSKASAVIGTDVKAVLVGIYKIIAGLFGGSNGGPPTAALLIVAAGIASQATGCGASASELNDRTAADLRAAAAIIRGITPEQQQVASSALGVLAEWVDSDFTADQQKVCGAFGVLDQIVGELLKSKYPVEPGILQILKLSGAICQANAGK